ncbi:MAG: hypothetical protein U9R05_07145 [Chloroflexota bacterium]|nr:hypothetical protein [Chloroflexota bacterium]
MSFRASGALAPRPRGIYYVRRELRNGTGRFLAGVLRALRGALARNDKRAWSLPPNIEKIHPQHSGREVSPPALRGSH